MATKYGKYRKYGKYGKYGNCSKYRKYRKMLCFNSKDYYQRLLSKIIIKHYYNVIMHFSLVVP